MTDTLKAGDTVWTVDGEWIQNFNDDYYAIKIPTHVCSHTVKDYYVSKYIKSLCAVDWYIWRNR